MVKNFKIIKLDVENALGGWSDTCNICYKKIKIGSNCVKNNYCIYHLSCFQKHTEKTIKRGKIILNNAKEKLKALGKYHSEMIIECLEKEK